MTSHPSQLRELRRSAGLTQKQLADLVGARQPHIARWERGDYFPQVPMAIRLAHALGSSVEAIWNEAAEEQRANAGASRPAT